MQSTTITKSIVYKTHTDIYMQSIIIVALQFTITQITHMEKRFTQWFNTICVNSLMPPSSVL